MKCYNLLFFNLYLFAPDHKKEALKDNLENIKKLKKEYLVKIFKEQKFKNSLFIKQPETLTNWNYFVNILNALLKNLKTTIVTFPSEKKEIFYKELIIFLDKLTSYLLWEKDGENELVNINCSKAVFPKNQKRAEWQTEDLFNESASEVLNHIKKNFSLFKNYLLIDQNLILIKTFLKIQLLFVKNCN